MYIKSTRLRNWAFLREMVLFARYGGEMEAKRKGLRDTGQKIVTFFQIRSLAGRFLLTGAALFSLLFLLIVVMLNVTVEHVLQSAIARNAQLQAQAMSLGLEQILAEARNQLLILAEGSKDRADMMRRLQIRVQAKGLYYREVAFMGLEPEDRYLYIIHNKEVIGVPERVFMSAPASPFHMISQEQKAGQVNISQPQEVVYSLLPVNKGLQSVTLQVIRLSTPVFADGRQQGVLTLSLDLKSLRNAMSLYASPDLPFGHGGKPLRSFFFDKEGWLLFQAERLETEHDAALSSGSVRVGFRGDFGRPGFSQAFRPSPDHVDYWSMVAETQAGKSGQIGFADFELHLAEGVSFAPVSFASSMQGQRNIIGGLAILDSNFTMDRTADKIRLIYACFFILGMLLLGASLWWLVRGMGRSLNRLCVSLENCNRKDEYAMLDLPPLPLEVEKIRAQIDFLLQRLASDRARRQTHEREQWESRQREAVEDLPLAQDLPGWGLVGHSPLMQALLHQLQKAAQVDADVLIVGETGTGKELVAESIHRSSARASGPYITINCGALDETLLMDTLFGHVKGAFTEAKQPRKGAFLAAEGGTLMLDEVGNATPKVQQALLRALSTRRIRPLGSDQDFAFDTRIIAATNAELRGDGQDGSFRDDLYYRLAVISIQTPPLRQRKEDIPALIVQFMAEAVAAHSQSMPRTVPMLSRGALSKFMAYDWPGNVRELKNTVTRALAFCDGNMLLAEDIQLDAAAPPDRLTSLVRATTVEDVLPGELPSAARPAISEKPSEEDLRSTTDTVIPSGEMQAVDAGVPLNSRQQQMLARLSRMGSITRQEYQDMSGGSISMRTAQYDLQTYVRLGYLRREGRGPAQRYIVLDGCSAAEGDNER